MDTQTGRDKLNQSSTFWAGIVNTLIAVLGYQFLDMPLQEAMIYAGTMTGIYGLKEGAGKLRGKS